MRRLADVLKLITQLMENIYETGEFPKVLIEDNMIALKKKLKGHKMQPHPIVA